MKIKLTKDFRVVDYDRCRYPKKVYSTGEVTSFDDEDAQWLIDNGFAEEVKESGWWKPKLGDVYYIAYPDGLVASCTWDGCTVDENRFLNGASFKTGEAAKRWRDYLKAIATVSQDEGFMRKNGGGFGWPVIEFTTNNPGVDDIAERRHAGEFYFDTREHALNSAMNHTREWQTILNYDWSRE